MRKQFEALFTEKELLKNEDGSYKYQSTRRAWIIYYAGYKAGSSYAEKKSA